VILILLYWIYSHISFMFNFVITRSCGTASDRKEILKITVLYGVLAFIFKTWALGNITLIVIAVCTFIGYIISAYLVSGFFRVGDTDRRPLILRMALCGVVEFAFYILLLKWLTCILFVLSLFTAILGIAIFIVLTLISGVKYLFRQS